MIIKIHFNKIFNKIILMRIQMINLKKKMQIIIKNQLNKIFHKIIRMNNLMLNQKMKILFQMSSIQENKYKNLKLI